MYKTLSEALEAIERYKSVYAEVVAKCYIVISVYERYLLDEISHAELAEEMKDLLDILPFEILNGRPERPKDESEDKK